MNALVSKTSILARVSGVQIPPSPPKKNSKIITKMQDYNQHFYEPIRRQIAQEFIQKELRKLLYSLDKNEMKKVDKDVEDWFNGRKSELCGVHDFWNGFEGISQGFKLKKLLPYLTAENISWNKREIPAKNIQFTTDLPITAPIAQKPFMANKIIEYINNPKNHDYVNTIKIDSDQHSTNTLPRDDYPIIVLKKDNEKYSILDGHRRTIRKIVYKKSMIQAYVGEYQTEKQMPQNFWISTGFLRNLKFLANLYSEDKELIKSISKINDVLIKNHQNVRFIYPKRVKDEKNI